jgi:hypothetical protein
MHPSEIVELLQVWRERIDHVVISLKQSGLVTGDDLDESLNEAANHIKANAIYAMPSEEEAKDIGYQKQLWHVMRSETSVLQEVIRRLKMELEAKSQAPWPPL